MKLNVKVDLNDKHCNFVNCVHYENGVCRNKESRKDCVEIAMAVLCINEDESDT